MPEIITLYTAKICPWAHRTELALKESKLPYKRFEIDLQNKPEWYAPKVNPASKVPAIAYGGPDVSPDTPSPDSEKLAESGVLIEFIAELSPVPLLPQDPVKRAKARFFIETVTSKFTGAFAGALHRGEDPSPLLDAIEVTQNLLPPEGFAVGEWTIADAAVTPFFARAEVALKNDVGKYAEGQGKAVWTKLESDPKFARFRKYLADVKSRASFKETFDEASKADLIDWPIYLELTDSSGASSWQFSMPKTLVVDDNVLPNFKYSGNWEYLSGSTRQWEGGIHSTFQNGATVSFRFRGSGFRVQGTIPGGSGNVLYEIITDGVSSGILTQAGSSANVYDAQFYAVSAPGLRDFVHTVVIANRGSQSNLDLRFDRVVLESLDADPTMTSPPPDPTPITTSTSTTTPSPPRSTTSTTTTSSTTSTTSSTSSSRTTALNLVGSSTTSSSSSSSSPSESTSLVTTTDKDGKIVTTQLIVTGGPSSVTPTGSVEPTTSATSATGSRGVPLAALIGGILGALVVVILVFLLFRQCRRRRYLRQHSQLKDDPAEKRGGVLPTPYDLGPHPGPSFGQTQDRGQNPFAEKTALQARVNEPESGTLGQSSSSGQGASSHHHHHHKGASTSTNPTTTHTCPCSNSAYTSAAQTSSAAVLSHRHSTSIHASSDGHGPRTGQKPSQSDQYLSGATVVAGGSSGMTSMYGETVRTSLYDCPPAYQAASTSEGSRIPSRMGHAPSHSISKLPSAPEANSS
ncbi:unnamed protein product [Cyclocybe aegerita]|uniref:GST N-terminal domain-containing protein n=1 Tax=Cyclocybe aegerita TaxID=1973307 RepID=A0A8S0VVU9_CYCAE|nr:unnamed protein product [Cyclocybe aegerita]